MSSSYTYSSCTRKSLLRAFSPAHVRHANSKRALKRRLRASVVVCKEALDSAVASIKQAKQEAALWVSEQPVVRALEEAERDEVELKAQGTFRPQLAASCDGLFEPPVNSSGA